MSSSSSRLEIGASFAQGAPWCPSVMVERVVELSSSTIFRFVVGGVCRAYAVIPDNAHGAGFVRVAMVKVLLTSRTCSQLECMVVAAVDIGSEGLCWELGTSIQESPSPPRCRPRAIAGGLH